MRVHACVLCVCWWVTFFALMYLVSPLSWCVSCDSFFPFPQRSLLFFSKAHCRVVGSWFARQRIRGALFWRPGQRRQHCRPRARPGPRNNDAECQRYVRFPFFSALFLCAFQCRLPLKSLQLLDLSFFISF